MRAPGRLGTGLLLLAPLLTLALVSRWWTPVPVARMQIPLRLKPPLSAGLLGTDAFGRDVLSQLMAGAWTSFAVAVTAVLAGLVLGVVLGLVAAARGGPLAEALLRLADVLFAFPALLLAIMLAALLGPGAVTAVLSIGLFAVPVFLRLTRALAVQVLGLDYCLAARSAGRGPAGVVLVHVLPNIAGPLAVQACLQLGLAILVEAGLSFLGLGSPPPTPSWGRMLADAQTFLGPAPWLALAPGLAIAWTVLGFTLLGDGLRDRLDPAGGAGPAW